VETEECPFWVGGGEEQKPGAFFLALTLSSIINNFTVSLHDNVPQMTITKIQK
jgi:hypothetical protein